MMRDVNYIPSWEAIPGQIVWEGDLVNLRSGLYRRHQPQVLGVGSHDAAKPVMSVSEVTQRNKADIEFNADSQPRHWNGMTLGLAEGKSGVI